MSGTYRIQYIGQVKGSRPTEVQESFRNFYSTALLFHCLQTLKQQKVLYTPKAEVAAHISFYFKAF